MHQPHDYRSAPANANTTKTRTNTRRKTLKEHIMEPGEIRTLCGRHRSDIYYQVYTWWEFARDHIDDVRANRGYWCLLCVDAVERRIAEEEWT